MCKAEAIVVPACDKDPATTCDDATAADCVVKALCMCGNEELAVD